MQTSTISEKHSEDKPNIILITIDTLRRDVLGSYGYNRRLTPNMDQLAETGIRFDQAITNGTWTQAAFPAILTSSYAAMYGGCLGHLAPERPSPIEHLAARGYNTGGFSTNPHISQATGYNRGFQYFVDLVPTEHDPQLRNIKGGQRLLQSPVTHYISRLIGKQTRPARLYSSAAEVTDTLCAWLDNIQTSFFAWVHFMDVHWPYKLEEELTHPQDIAQAWQDMATMHELASNGSRPMPTKLRNHFIKMYEQSLQYLDAQIGRLLNYLEGSGHLANTVIILVADHGEEFLEHDRWGHWESNLHDEILRVPLIIQVPGWTEGQVIIERQVQTIDIMPTILDLCDCPLTGNMEGMTMTPLWVQSAGQYEGEIAISEMRRDPWHRVAVRTENFKYIWDSKHPDQPVLYNLKTDPAETQNVREQFPEQVRRLQEHVDGHLRRVAETESGSTVLEIEHDEEILKRLRDLGYVE